MLKTRAITALILFALLTLVLLSHSFFAFLLVATVFFAAAVWESFRLFDAPHPRIGTLIWVIAFLLLVLSPSFLDAGLLALLCAAIWIIRFVPALGMGLPSLNGFNNRFLHVLYRITILGCFIAITYLIKHSALYLLSVMAIVWGADIGAYFAGKAFGKRKLAPSISPGKSWEGAIGGWLAVLLMMATTVMFPAFGDTFPVKLQEKWGWGGFLGVMTLLVAASIVGDLFESQLKRRVGIKDSSNLLPGHGGVLDRIDALIPVLPLAIIIDAWL